jgi:hypothetical protein
VPALLVALLAPWAAAAVGVEEGIARCAAASSPEERIACLEDTLRQLAGASPAAAVPAGPAATPAPEEPERRATASTPPPAAEERPGATPGEQPPARPAPASPMGTPEAELGAEQVEARSRTQDEEAPRVHATVVDFRFVGYSRLMVQLDNGQVWRQIDGDRESVERGLRDNDTFEVEMWPTKLGGYRMRILSLERTIRVERLQ